MNLLEQIDLTNIPKHIAIIMDGNGRWAKKQGQERLYGHSFGVDSVRATLTACKDVGVKFVTMYAFSTENWNRPQDEVEGLMSLLVYTIANEVNELNAQNVKLLSIGDTAGLPEDCQDELKNAIESTKNNTGVNLVIALNYSSRWEIAEAFKQLASNIQAGDLTISEITPELISSTLSTKHIPDPELLIRTSGEQRLSNFLLWQVAYSEFYFTPVLWPDFREVDLYKAVLDYQSRERRFGMVSEQL
ncbi:isoprenyl transferase [Fluviicola taffensis]|uniref:Isoprenyl transferase n=1 Tax=Fluviicola taffensis (strain DSM 16823 / NCIMB 13979 / RW262) TaxID=755732 RepID=F2IAH7_FLUTR|nr:isoprenyl transferase [Fluviicola taffensis]AEA43113.1 Undecaprenyl pyrophosphate synthase [Fluviicola taffensis DSM 16823]